MVQESKESGTCLEVELYKTDRALFQVELIGSRYTRAAGINNCTPAAGVSQHMDVSEEDVRW